MSAKFEEGVRRGEVVPFRKTSARVGEAQVLDALRPVRDPWFRRGIGELGLVLDVNVRGATVGCTVAVPVDGNGLHVLHNDIETALRALEGVDQVEIHWKPMTEGERLVADYAGTGLTIGRHPMALRRDDLAMRGVLRASDLHVTRQGRRVRVAGMVITRQRPGTAKGFVFLTLEDETGIANIIVRPDLFARDRLVIVEEPFLIVDGVLQNQDGVTSVRAEQIVGLRGGIADGDLEFDTHDFY